MKAPWFSVPFFYSVFFDCEVGESHLFLNWRLPIIHLLKKVSRINHLNLKIVITSLMGIGNYNNLRFYAMRKKRGGKVIKFKNVTKRYDKTCR